MQLSFSMLSVLSHHTKQHDAVCICVPVGVGALLGRFQMTGGSCRPSQLVVQFTSEGSTLSGCDIQLVGTGYRLSLIKKRFAAGQFEYQRCVCVCVVMVAERLSNTFHLAPQGNIWRTISPLLRMEPKESMAF